MKEENQREYRIKEKTNLKRILCANIFPTLGQIINTKTYSYIALLISALDLAISSSMAMVYDELVGSKVWQCLHCSKTNKDKTAISRHVESHLQGHSHSCSICHKTYKPDSPRWELFDDYNHYNLVTNSTIFLLLIYF